MAKLDYFTETSFPDNKHKKLIIDPTEKIIVGADCLHVLTFPFSFEEDSYVAGLDVYYKQGLDIVLVKSIDIGSNSGIHYNEEKNETTVIIELNSAETLLFNHPGRQTYTQARLILGTGKVYYTDFEVIQCIFPIDLDYIPVNK